MRFWRETRMRGVLAAGACLCALVLVILAGLWPIGLGGAMPVGGDATGFFMGLMAFLGESLRESRVPLWNDLWGFGFPGLAESQMGVFYPVHLLLYGFWAVESAYVLSLVIHTVFGGLGSYWLARRFGVTPLGASLAAAAWSMSGFFLIHLAHPWGYTTGCYIPWALGLGWLIVAGSCQRGWGLLTGIMAFVLALQLLPGHFQLAFETQFALVLLAAFLAIERTYQTLRSRQAWLRTLVEAIQRGSLVILGIAGAFALAAIQIVPTARLAILAGDDRDFAYLSGFAATPFHLVNWMAPGLFHHSRLWRPLVWDPFHTSPEELLTYVGLAPLLLAFLAMRRLWRTDQATRALMVLAATTFYLSLGPYVPGFHALIHVPGFSFFRAPARWNVITSLALAILAGKGLDGWLIWSRPAQGGRRLIALGLAAIGLTLATVELALVSGGQNGVPVTTALFDHAFHWLPWSGDPSFRAVAARADAPDLDPRIPPGAAPSVALRKNIQATSFRQQRTQIYLAELAETLGLFAGLFAVLWLSQHCSPGRARLLFFTLTAADLVLLSTHRLIDVGPLARLVDQSPVLDLLHRMPRGVRVADHLGNLTIDAGAAPVAAYRTLNLPAVDSLTALARSLAVAPSERYGSIAALSAVGAGIRIYDPLELRTLELLKRDPGPLEYVDDPALASWLMGRDWVLQQGNWARRFGIARTASPPVRAWFLPASAQVDRTILESWSGDPRAIIDLLNECIPLPALAQNPQQDAVLVDVDEPGWLIISRLYDPLWSARWVGEDHHPLDDAEIQPAFRQPGRPGGWQRIEIPADGRALLLLEYENDDFTLGLAITIVAASAWTLLMTFLGVKPLLTRLKSRPGPSPPGPAATSQKQPISAPEPVDRQHD